MPQVDRAQSGMVFVHLLYKGHSGPFPAATVSWLTEKKEGLMCFTSQSFAMCPQISDVSRPGRLCRCGESVRDSQTTRAGSTLCCSMLSMCQSQSVEDSGREQGPWADHRGCMLKEVKGKKEKNPSREKGAI